MKWEYRTETIEPFNMDDGLKYLNYLGRDGWEAIGVYAYSQYTSNGVVLLKRALPSTETSTGGTDGT